MEEAAILEIPVEEVAAEVCEQSPTEPGPQVAEDCVTGEKETIDYNAEYRREKVLQMVLNLGGSNLFDCHKILEVAAAFEKFLKGEVTTQ